MLFRDLCESYLGLNPLILQEMTIDQLILLSCDRNHLKYPGKIVRSPPAYRYHSDIPHGMTLLEFRRAEKWAADEVARRRSKKERRRLRDEALRKSLATGEVERGGS